MDIKNIVKNLFITQPDYPDSFAILANDTYESDDGQEQLLLCYYNPTHFEMDENGKWHMGNEVLSCEIGTESCEYTIPNDEIEYWRECTSAEINRAVKLLADKRIAWENGRLRKMATGETLNFGTNPNPYYRNQYRPSTPSTPKNKYITKTVREDWEQIEPITVMSIDHRELLLEECKKPLYQTYYPSCQGTAYHGTYNGIPVVGMYDGAYQDEYNWDW